MTPVHRTPARAAATTDNGGFGPSGPGGRGFGPFSLSRGLRPPLFLPGRYCARSMAMADSKAMSASAPAAASDHERRAPGAARLIVAASLGNALEFYEILVYGYFAVTLSRVFFPAADERV